MAMKVDSRNFFDSIYDKLILRDLVGKVVPGAVLLLAVAVSLYDPAEVSRFLASVTWSISIVGGGVAWLLAFALQYVGELLRLLRTHPKKGDLTRDEFFQNWARFHATASDQHKVHAERLNVIKEACGNGAMALFVGSILVPIGQLLRGGYKPVPMCMLLTVSILAGVALWQMHLEHVERYGSFVDNVLGLDQELLRNTESDAEADNKATAVDG